MGYASAWAFARAGAFALWILAGSSVRAGDVLGTVSFAGAAPAPAPIPTTKDRTVCGDAVEDESLVVTDGRVANAIVLLKGAPPAAPARVALDQQRCRYRPHVQVAPVGSTLDVMNGDPLLHSVHGWAGRMTRFDVVTPSKGMRVPTRLDRPGLIQVRCDVHSWMTAWVLVADGPAAVTGPDGTFTLRDVPAGKYTVTTWHERLGERSSEVAVPERGEVRLQVRYGG